MQVIPVRHFLQYRTSYDAADDTIEVTWFFMRPYFMTSLDGFFHYISWITYAGHHYFSL